MFIICLVLFSCQKEEGNPEGFIGGVDCEENCDVLNPFSFSITPIDDGIQIGYGQQWIIDSFGKVCSPDSLDFYFAKSNEEFEKIRRVVGLVGSFVIEDLEEDAEYKVKMVNLHCELDSIIARTLVVSSGDVALPTFTPSAQVFEDFRMSPDGDRYIYRSSSNDWYIGSLSNPLLSEKIIEEAFYAEWNPRSNSEIAYVQQTRVDITASTQGITSEALMSYNIDSGISEILHEIEFLHDFGTDHNPEQYWIHEFRYSNDGNSIYFVSNKDNGSSDRTEKKVFNNIWKIDLATKELVSITDFLPLEFEMRDFIEDPKNSGNFYILGGTYGEMVENGGWFNTDSVDVYYYSSATSNLAPIFISDHEEQYIDVDPVGEHLTFVSDRAGSKNIWRFSLEDQSLKQITNSAIYSPSWSWHHINWVSDNEFMTYVRMDGESNFATFRVD